MIPANTAQTAFTSGELSPLILGRNDVEKFGMGGERVENFIAVSQGPLVRRSGTIRLSVDNAIFRLIPFIYSRDEAYTLKLFGSTGQVYSTEGKLADITGVMPYTPAEAMELSYTQSADVIFLTHPNHPPAKVSRYGGDDWRYEQISFKNGPFLNYTQESEDGISLELINIVDITPLTVVPPDGASVLSVGDYIQYTKQGVRILGIVQTVTGNVVEVSSLEDMCYSFPPTVFSPGVYDGWDKDNGVPKYKTFYRDTVTGAPYFGEGSGVLALYVEYTVRARNVPGGSGLARFKTTYIVRLATEPAPIPGETFPIPGYPDGVVVAVMSSRSYMDTGVPTGNIDSSISYPVAFSNSQVITREMVGGYINFANEQGQYFWGALVKVGNILEQGAYGILGDMRLLTVKDIAGTVTPGDRTITARLRATSDVFIAPRDDGRVVRLAYRKNVLFARILPGQIQSPTECLVSLSQSPPRDTEAVLGSGNPATTDWDFGAWYTGNYPACCCFFEDRFVFAGSLLEPQTIWMSVTGDYYNFAPSDPDAKVLDTSAITLTLASSTMNRIKWICPRNTLSVGTLGSEWIIQASSTTVSLTPTNVQARNHSNYGSELPFATAVGRSVLYVQRGATKLREMAYDYSTDSYVSTDVTIFSEHILREGGGVVSQGYQGNPNSLFFSALVNGGIAALAYEPEQKVYSWARLTFSSASCRSLACVDTRNSSGVFICLEHNPGVFSLEYLPLDEDASGDMVGFSDGRVNVSTSTAVWNAAAECWEVSLIGSLYVAGVYGKVTNIAYLDGNPIPGATILPEGSIRFPKDIPQSYPMATAKIVLGTHYDSIYRSFPLDAQTQAGPVQGKTKRLENVVFRFKDTVGGRIGRSLEAYPKGTGRTPIEWERLEDRRDIKLNPNYPASFDYRVPLPNGFDTRAQFTIMQDKPLPMTILSFYPEAHLSE